MAKSAEKGSPEKNGRAPTVLAMTGVLADALDRAVAKGGGAAKVRAAVLELLRDAVAPEQPPAWVTTHKGMIHLGTPLFVTQVHDEDEFLMEFGGLPKSSYYDTTWDSVLYPLTFLEPEPKGTARSKFLSQASAALRGELAHYVPSAVTSGTPGGKKSAGKKLTAHEQATLDHKLGELMNDCRKVSCASVEKLLMQGASANATNVSEYIGGYPLIYQAAVANRVDLIELLLQYGADVNAAPKLKLTALHGASDSGAVEAARLLLEHGADLKALSELDETPLHVACLSAVAPASPPPRKSLALAELLLDKGAAVDAAVEANGEKGPTPLVKLLQARYEGRAHAKGDIRPLIELLLGRDASVRERVLPLAALNGLGWLVEHCVKAGASLDGTYAGRTGLHFAVMADLPEMITLLLKLGAQPNTPDELGYSPLWEAVERGRKACLERLVAAGATGGDVKRGPAKKTPLHEAIEDKDRATIVKLLADPATDVNRFDDRGLAPLHIAVADHYTEGIKLLAAKGANLDLPAARSCSDFEDDIVRGWRPLDIAIMNASAEKLLKKLGARDDLRGVATTDLAE